MDRREEILQSLQRAGSRRVQDIIAGQRFRIGGHILRVPKQTCKDRYDMGTDRRQDDGGGGGGGGGRDAILTYVRSKAGG